MVPANLTPEMLAAVDRMRFTQSVALVRVQSQWWAAENDLPVPLRWVSAAEADAAPRSERDKLQFGKPVFWTGTVNALVKRGVLKFDGPKRKATTPPYDVRAERAIFRY